MDTIKKIKSTTLWLSIFLILTCFSCKSLNQLVAFSNCKYEFNGLNNPTIAGISFQGIQDVDKLNVTSLLQLTTSLLSGSLPLSATINVNATNPNKVMAQIAGLEWAIDVNNSTLLTGTVTHQVSIPPNGGKTTIPFTFQTDIMKLLKGETKDNVLKFVNSMLHAGESSSNVSVRIKPTIKIGNRNVSTGYITLKKTI